MAPRVARSLSTSPYHLSLITCHASEEKERRDGKALEAAPGRIELGRIRRRRCAGSDEPADGRAPACRAEGGEDRPRFLPEPSARPARRQRAEPQPLPARVSPGDAARPGLLQPGV